jgi:hypothetical protein
LLEAASPPQDPGGLFGAAALRAHPPLVAAVDDFVQLLGRQTPQLDRHPSADRDEEVRPQGRQSPRPRRRDSWTPEELLDIIEAKGREVAEALAQLRSLCGASG